MKYTKEQILNDFPRLFKNKNSCIYGLETNDGWNDLIYNVSSLIEDAIEYRMNLQEEGKSECYAIQIKSKFGGLRFYVSFDDPYVNGIIALAEKLSYSMCEFCGQKASLVEIKKWYWTLCTEHYMKELERKK